MAPSPLVSPSAACGWPKQQLAAHVATPTIRLRGIRLLEKLAGLSWAQAELVDRGVAHATLDDESYIAEMKRLCYNGVCNPSLFSGAHGPLEHLAGASDASISCAALRLLEEAQQERELAISAMLKQKYDSVAASAADTRYTMLRCRACRSSDITWQQKQMRGADESMTVFLCCESCGARWKMS